jgi:hypothetical protein
VVIPARPSVLPFHLPSLPIFLTFPKPPQPGACSGNLLPSLSTVHPTRWIISRKSVGRSPTGRVKTCERDEQEGQGVA